MKTIVRPAILLTLVFTILCGLVYPALITVIARSDGDAHLIGQTFSEKGHFWGRLSEGINLGPTNPALVDLVKARVQALHDADPDNQLPIPIDLVTSSASGLDPDISPAAARYQVHRVAAAHGLPDRVVADLVEAHVVGRTFGILGEPRVNVLELNLAVDALPTQAR